jgi:catechol 2,3-dioxygenase-like lactoylglutathione lyase family enzyme
MDWTLELIVVPVSDVDRAKSFYAERVGFEVTTDRQVSEDFRVVQLTPRGSGCSIGLLAGRSSMAPGSLQGLQLVVSDVRAAQAELRERGIEVGDVQVFEPDGPRPARESDDLNYTGFAFFSDPDGNGWAVQQIDARG